MGKSLYELMAEAAPPPPPPPPPPGGALGGAGGAGPIGGGMPPPPPMGGGMGGPPMGDPMGGGGAGGQQQPVPIKTIDAMDVWEVLKKSVKDMDKYDELNINYERKKSKTSMKSQDKPKDQKNSSLMT